MIKLLQNPAASQAVKIYLWQMNIFRLLIELFVLYLLYKLIFDFIIPVYRASKQMKRKMRDMQEQYHRQQQNFSSPQQSQTEQPQKEEKVGDYIDFEEIK